jgi:hypothetical protein
MSRSPAYRKISEFLGLVEGQVEVAFLKMFLQKKNPKILKREKTAPLYILREKTKWNSHFGKPSGSSLKCYIQGW